MFGLNVRGCGLNTNKFIYGGPNMNVLCSGQVMRKVANDAKTWILYIHWKEI